MYMCVGVQINAGDSILWNVFPTVELLGQKYVYFRGAWVAQ